MTDMQPSHTMNPLIIELKPGQRQSFTFVGWRGYRVAFYARDEAGNAKVIKLGVVYPHNLDNGQPFEFPNIEPVNIFPCRLVPPGDEKTATDQNAMNQAAQEFASQWWNAAGTARRFSAEAMKNHQAAVRFGVRFKVGMSLHVSGVHIRNILTPEEAEEFEKLELVQRASHPTQPEVKSTVTQLNVADPKQTELLADAHRMLSGGIMLTVGKLMDKMNPADKLLFNFLVSANPNRPGWALSYRDIGDRLLVSQTEVKRRRTSLERKCGRDITIFIAEARAKNEKGMNPDVCGSGQKRKTANTHLNTNAD